MGIESLNLTFSKHPSQSQR